MNKTDYYLRLKLPEYIQNHHHREIRMKANGKSKNFQCLNAQEHRNGDSNPSMGIYTGSDGTPRAHCHACGANYSIYDLIMEDYHCDFKQAKQKALELYGTPDQKTIAQLNKLPRYERRKLTTDLNPLVNKAHEYYKDFKALHGYQEKIRGLSPEVIDRYKIGAVETDINDLLKDYPELSVNIADSVDYSFILPFIDEQGNAEYFITERTRNRHKGAKYLNLRDYPTPIFNRRYITSERSNLTAITEGIYDSLSFESVGVDSMALCGVGQVDELINLINSHRPGNTFLIATDNDSEGKKAADRLSRAFDSMGINYFLMDYPEGIKDPNEYLTQKRQEFNDLVLNIVQLDRNLRPDGITDDQMDLNEYIADNTPVSFLDNYLNNKIENGYDPLPTGFSKVDNIIGYGLRKGLITIGASSGLGKTTFCLQIADNLARTGKDVLFITLEMDREELMDKSISRETYRVSPDTALSYIDLVTPETLKQLNSDQIKHLNKAVETYQQYAPHLYFIERELTFSIEDIENAVNRHKRLTGNTPVVFIDYLQILNAPEGAMSEKQAIDMNVTRLRNLAKKYRTPVILISSMNRASYGDRVSYKSFSGSAGIEYSSDQLIGLNYNLESLIDIDEPDSLILPQEETELRIALKLANHEPIMIDVELLKNRWGRAKRRTALKFNPEFNIFYED